MAKLIDASDALRRLMAAHDLTQAEVAEAARVTVVTANRWVNGKQRADSETIARAIRRLGDDPAAYGVVLRRPLDEHEGGGEFLAALESCEARIEERARQRHEETMTALRNIRDQLIGGGMA
jgi:transcriptional regulator with XRE-family HTH domain